MNGKAEVIMTNYKKYVNLGLISDGFGYNTRSN